MLGEAWGSTVGRHVREVGGGGASKCLSARVSEGCSTSRWGMTGTGPHPLERWYWATPAGKVGLGHTRWKGGTGPHPLEWWDWAKPAGNVGLGRIGRKG